MKRLWKYQDQTLEVTMEAIGDSFELKIGEQKYITHISEIRPNLYSVSIDGKVYEVKSEKIKSDKNYLFYVSVLINFSKRSPNTS